MNKLITAVMILFCFFSEVNAQDKSNPVYDVVVRFGSMCCGTVSDSFLLTYTKDFEAKQKVSLPACKSTGCGKEGEYNIMFCLAHVKPAAKARFIKELETLIVLEDKKNKANNSSSGSINLEFNMSPTDFSFCRGGIAKWE